MFMLLMYIRFWQNIDCMTCLPGGLPNLDFACVRKVLATYCLYDLLTSRSENVDFAYVRKVWAVS